MASPFVTELDEDACRQLRRHLEAEDFSFSQPPHTQFSARKPGLSCTLYKSGKLVVQGKGADEFIRFYLEPNLLQATPYSYPAIDRTPHIGCDEAGKGDFYGPLCIAGVYADERTIDQFLELGIADSKSLKDPRILQLARQIAEITPIHVIVLNPPKYNELYERFGNLNHLLAWAHASIIEELHGQTGCNHALVDQFAKPPVLESALRKKRLELQVEQRVRAESDVVVAAASIVARASFVRGIERLGGTLGIELPKGANSHIKTVGRQIVASHGREALDGVSKRHFKTTQEIHASASDHRKSRSR